MPRSPKDNQEIRSSRRDEIVAAATRVFAKKGFAGAKISEVAAEAGLSHGLVYHYFESKDAIFSAIATAMMARMDRDLLLAIPRALDRLLASMAKHQTRLESDIDEGRIVLQAVLDRSIPPDTEIKLRAHFRALFEGIAGWIGEAQSQGDIEPNLHPDELAAGLICLYRGMSLRVPGIVELPFQPPRPHTIARMLCLTERGQARAHEVIGGPVRETAKKKAAVARTTVARVKKTRVTKASAKKASAKKTPVKKTPAKKSLAARSTAKKSPPAARRATTASTTTGAKRERSKRGTDVRTRG